MGWGDELMVTGQVRELQARDPRRVRIVYEKPRWHDAWLYNPRIAQPGENGEFQEFRPRTGYLRPYIAAKDGERWTWRAYRPPRGELYFKNVELKTGEKHPGRIILEPALKAGASPNKQWGWVRWQQLARLLVNAGYPVAQMGESAPPIGLPGAEFIWTRSMRLAATVIAKARAVVVPEGGLHHVAAAVGTPAVVIFGGFISPDVTGYDDQANLFTGQGLGCGMRIRCEHCKKAMAAITPELVMEELRKLLG